MPNEVKIIFTGDPSHLFRTADAVDARLARVGTASLPNPSGSAAAAFSQPALQSRSIQSVSAIKQVDSSLERAINNRIKEFTDDIERQSRRAKPSILDNPLNPPIDKRISELKSQAAARVPERSLIPQGPVSPFETSFAKNTKDLAPNIAAARAQQEKYKDVLGQVVGLSKEQTTLVTASASKLGITAATLGSIAAIASVGAVAIGLTYKYTTEIRQEAERRLKVEEQIQAAINKQILAGIELRDAFKKSEKESEEKFLLDRFIKNTPTDLLEARKRILETLIGNDQQATRPGLEKYFEELKAINAELRRAKFNQKDLNAAAQDSAFEQRNINFKNAQEAERKRQAEFLENIEKGKEKVKELGKVYTDTFTSLTLQANQNNPFVKLAIDGDTALKKLQETLRGLPKDLQTVAIEAQKTINARELFSTRVSTAFEAADLREEARRLRSIPGADGPVDKQTFDRIVAANIARGNQFQFGGTFGSDQANRAGGIDKLTDEQKRRIFEVSLLGSATPGLNRDSLISSLARDRIRNPQEDLSAQERLDRQLKLAGSFNARTEDEKGIIDSRILALGRGINPAEIRSDQREKLAAAFERQAERTERREQEALDVAKRMLTINEQIAENQKRLLGVAEKQGLTGVQILVRNQTDDELAVEAGNQQDTRDTYEFSGFGVAGGSNR